MATQARKQLAELRTRLAERMDYAGFLAKFSEKDRKSLARHQAVLSEKFGAESAALWARVACALITLAPHSPRCVAQQAVHFFIPDGPKYRKQVFGLQATDAGGVIVYSENVLAEAIRAGVLAKPKAGSPGLYRVADSDDTVPMEELDGKTPNPALVFKHMTGWNRKAVGMTLAPQATTAQIEAVEAVCALTALDWLAAVPQA